MTTDFGDLRLRPFVGWRQDAWAYDLPSFLRVAAARTALEPGCIGEIEALLAPVWGHIGSNDHLQALFYLLEDEGIKPQLVAAWAPRSWRSRSWSGTRPDLHGLRAAGDRAEPEGRQRGRARCDQRG